MPNTKDENIRVTMVCNDLSNTPRFELPEGFSLRLYRPGDEEAWLELQKESEPFETITQEHYDKAFGKQPEALPERQLFLLNPDNRPIGTATAWFDDLFFEITSGRVHWVAIHPSHQGRGLAKPLLGMVCQRMRELGHRRACLATSTGRIAAINLYLQFGFLPNIRAEEDARIWGKMERLVNRPKI